MILHWYKGVSSKSIFEVVDADRDKGIVFCTVDAKFLNAVGDEDGRELNWLDYVIILIWFRWNGT